MTKINKYRIKGSDKTKCEKNDGNQRLNLYRTICEKSQYDIHKQRTTERNASDLRQAHK